MWRDGVPELVVKAEIVSGTMIEEPGVTPDELFGQVLAARRALERDRVPHRTLLDRWLPPSGTIAEVGCGTAFASGFYRSKDRRFVALDLDGGMLRQVKRAYPDVEVAACDSRALPLADASLDALVGVGIFELDGARGVLGMREAARVLKPGGLLYACITYTNLVRSLGLAPRWRGNTITTLSKQEVRKLLDDNGLQVKMLRECSFAHWLGPFKRVAGLFPTVLAAEHDTALSYRMLRPALAMVANSLVIAATKA